MGTAWNEAVVQATDGSRIGSSRQTDACDDATGAVWDGWGNAWIPAPAGMTETVVGPAFALTHPTIMRNDKTEGACPCGCAGCGDSARGPGGVQRGV
jgi:hypothetical protein